MRVLIYSLGQCLPFALTLRLLLSRRHGRSSPGARHQRIRGQGSRRAALERTEFIECEVRQRVIARLDIRRGSI